MTRRRLLTGLAMTLLVACEGPPTGPTGLLVALDLVSGNVQTGVVGTELADPLVIRALEADSTPIAGQIVNFVVVSGGGQVFAGAAITNADGLAQERWTLGTNTADSQRVEVRAVNPATGAPQMFGVFTAIPLPAAPASVRKVSGDSQVAVVGQGLAESLAVTVLDRFLNPVTGASVAWAVTSGSATPSPTASTVSPGGTARTRVTLGTTIGNVTVTATSGPFADTFVIRAAAGSPASVSKLVGDSQLAVVDMNVPILPTVIVRDSLLNPVAGITVSFAVPPGQGSVAPASVVTDSSGQAAVVWRMGWIVGSYSLVATVTGLGPVSFSAIARSGPPASMTIVQETIHWAAPGSAVAGAPSVRLRDAYGNVVPGASVTFTPAGAGSVTGGTSLTDSTGLAVVGSWTLGSSSTPNTLVASAGTGLSATFIGNLGTRIDSVPGHIAELQPDRVLYGIPSSGAYVVRTLSSGTDLVVSPAGSNVGRVALTPLGVIHNVGGGAVGVADTVVEWRNGLRSARPLVALKGVVEVAGDNAIFTDGPNLYRRNLLTGADTLLTSSALNDGAGVAANGDVAWTSSPSPFRAMWLHAGVTIDLAPGDTLWALDLLTDGLQVVFRKITPCCFNQIHWIVRHSGSAETTLSGPMTRQPILGDYLVNNGWTAWVTKVGATSEVYARSPGGVISQVATLANDATILGLGPGGQIVATNRLSSAIYAEPPYSSVVALGQVNGFLRWDGTRFQAGLPSGAIYALTP